MVKFITALGIPGCGKSTFFKNMFEGVPILSTDALRLELFGSLEACHSDNDEDKRKNNGQVFDEFFIRMETLLLSYNSVVADNTNLFASHRQKCMRLAEKYNAEKHIFVFDNREQAVWRNAEREGGERVPDDIMDKMSYHFEREMNRVMVEDWDSITFIREVF